MIKRSIILTVVFLLQQPCLGAAAHKPFRSDLLERMAVDMQIYQSLDTLDDGFYYREYHNEGKPVSVSINKGEVTHIGYSLFPVSVRHSLPGIICDFLERYTLELSLPNMREQNLYRKMREDGLVWLQGSPEEMVAAMCADTTLSIELTNILGRRYSFSWKTAVDSGNVVFPADWRLISGRGMVENERRIPAEVEITEILPPAPLPDTTDMTNVDEGIYMVDDGNYYIQSLTSVRYYQAGEGLLKVFDDPSRIDMYSANLFSGVGLDNNHVLAIKMRVYPLQAVVFKVPLDKWLSYCLTEGCKPYWGIVRREGNMLEGELVMRNTTCGYNHIMRIWMSVGDLARKEGEIQARLVPFVPMHNVSFLFDEIKL